MQVLRVSEKQNIQSNYLRSTRNAPLKREAKKGWPTYCTQRTVVSRGTSKLMTQSTVGMSRPREATSVAIKMRDTPARNFPNAARRRAWQSKGAKIRIRRYQAAPVTLLLSMSLLVESCSLMITLWTSDKTGQSHMKTSASRGRVSFHVQLKGSKFGSEGIKSLP